MSEVFNIRQESDLSEWTSVASDDAIWAAAAGLAGSAGGMQVTIDDTTATYGSKTISLSGLTNIRFRYYIKRTTLAMTEGDDFGIIRVRASATPWDLIRMTVTRTAVGTGFRLSVTIFKDDTTTLALPLFEDFGTGEHYVEVRVQRASSAVASDGEVGWWVDGNYIGGRADVDNYDLWLLVIAFLAGATSLIDATTSGVFYLDELVLRNDDTAIGPVGILGPIAMYNQMQRLGAY